MEYAKTPLTTQEHLTNLSTRGLIIDEPERATRYLDTLGYYRLSAYFIPFELPSNQNNSRNHKFKKNTNFQKILDLYVFDRKLRLLVMEAIERIEVALRSQWANGLAQETKNAHAFMDTSNFTNLENHSLHINMVKKNLENNNEAFINHYKNKYSKPCLPPIWAVNETFTLGQLSKWLQNTKDNSIKKSIALNLGFSNTKTLLNAVQCLSLVRNICAHHGRLWNRHLIKRLTLIKELNNIMQLQKEIPSLKDKPNNQNKHLSNKLYNYLILISHIMHNLQPNTSWKERLVKHLQKTTSEQQFAMGFPIDWEQLHFWKPS